MSQQGPPAGVGGPPPGASGPPSGGDPCAAAAARGGYIDPNFPRPNTPDTICIIIYGYTPSFILCVIALVLFFLALFAHSFQLAKYRTWYFIPLTIGLLLEIVGYIARTFSSRRNPYSVIYFVVQYFFIVTAPVMFSAAIYTLISISISRIGRNFAPLGPKLILTIFIVADVIATLVQVAGASLIGVAQSSAKDPTTANNILLGGLAFQVFTFAVFIIIFSLFVWRSRHATSRTYKRFAFATMVATVAVYVRTILRLAETAQGLMGSISTNEIYFGVFEFAPIVVAVYTFIFFHPGRYLGSKTKQGKALEREGMVLEDRSTSIKA